MSAIVAEIRQAAIDGDYDEVTRLGRMLDDQTRRDLILASRDFITAMVKSVPPDPGAAASAELAKIAPRFQW